MEDYSDDQGAALYYQQQLEQRRQWEDRVYESAQRLAQQRGQDQQQILNKIKLLRQQTKNYYSSKKTIDSDKPRT